MGESGDSKSTISSSAKKLRLSYRETSLLTASSRGQQVQKCGPKPTKRPPTSINTFNTGEVGTFFN